jgi:uncharacterized lipoprotein YddW (UPF0748 family)
MPSSRPARLPALLFAALLAAACSGDGPSGPGSDDKIAEVVLSHDSATLTQGASLQLQATVRSASRAPLTRPVAWSSSAPAVAAVEGGMVRALTPGTALVVARAEGVADTARITVVELPSGKVEARALWVNRFEYMTGQGPTADQAKIRHILERARSANFNLVYFQVRGMGDAYYKSALEPCAITLCGKLGNGQPTTWDPLEFAVTEAHARGLQLHAWLNALSAFASPVNNNAAFCTHLAPSAAGSPQHMLIAHPEWAMVNASGVRQSCENSTAVEYVYVSPAIPAVRTHLARVAADVARRYAVDGIHLDRIRYPGTAWSHDTTSLRLFGRDPAADPAGWEQFRRERVNLAVKETHDSIRAATPRKVVLSAAVWGIYDPRKWGWPSSSGIAQFYQDPRAWAQGGYLDVSVPMTYFSISPTKCSYVTNSPDWACLLDDHLQGYRASGRHVYIGIGANRPLAEIERQVLLGRQEGVKGFALYAYTALENASAWTALASGVFREKAEIPAMGWR